MNSTIGVDFPLCEPQNADELADLVQNTIAHIQEIFGQMSNSILTQIDDVGQQIDQLEHNIAQVVSQTNAQLP